ncbi:hypothetical protein [Cryptosporangium phraense]|nr:hypothetical protein [Cryptosporangium phraense]
MSRLLADDPHHVSIRNALERAHADLALGRAIVPGRRRWPPTAPR